MKNLILSIFATNYGTIVRFAVSAIVGSIVALLSKIGLEMSDEQVLTLAGITTAVVSGLIGEYVLKNQGEGIAKIQAYLRELSPAVFVDKWAGPATVRAVELASIAVKKAAEPETVVMVKTELSSPETPKPEPK